MNRPSRVCAFVLAVLLCASSSSAFYQNRILAFLSTPKGVTTVGCTFAFLAGATDFVWAFNWKRVGYTDEQNSRIQEAGGMANMAVSWVFGALIPFYAYTYVRYVQQNQAVAPIAAAAAVAQALPENFEVLVDL